MKEIFKFLFFTLFVLSPFCFTGCSDEEEDISQIELTDTPYYTKAFLQNCFPGHIPESVVKYRNPDPETGIQIVVTYPNGVKVEFDEEGVWQQVLSMDGISLSIFPDNLISQVVRQVVTKSYDDQAVVGISRKDYGEDILLADNQLLSFNSSYFLGTPVPESDYNEVPAKASQFVMEHFPQTDWKMVIRAPLEEDEYKPRYRLWLTNDYYLEFNNAGEWVTIEGYKQLIPESIIATLPEGLLNDIDEYYTDSQITELYRMGKEHYRVRVNSTASYTYNPERNNIVWPTDQIYAFRDRYFGKVDCIMSHPLWTEEQCFIIKMKNGFDFTVDKEGEWLEVDGHGFSFPALLYEILPNGIYEYLNNQVPNAEITTAKRVTSYGYYIVLTDGNGYKFNSKGAFIAAETEELAPYAKAVKYIRYNYPKELSFYFSLTGGIGWTFTFDNSDLILKFDTEGNIIQK